MLNEAIFLPPARARIIHHRRVYNAATGLYTLEVVDDFETHNLITDAGRVTIHTYLYGSGSQRSALGGGFNYIGLTNDSGSPAAGDTALTAELVGNGLTRGLATVTLPTGSGNQTVLQRVFTYSGGSPQGVQKSALFDAASSGHMAHEITFPQRTLFPTDTLTVQYTITVG